MKAMCLQLTKLLKLKKKSPKRNSLKNKNQRKNMHPIFLSNNKILLKILSPKERKRKMI